MGGEGGGEKGRGGREEDEKREMQIGNARLHFGSSSSATILHLTEGERRGKRGRKRKWGNGSSLRNAPAFLSAAKYSRTLLLPRHRLYSPYSLRLGKGKEGGEQEGGGRKGRRVSEMDARAGIRRSARDSPIATREYQSSNSFLYLSSKGEKGKKKEKERKGEGEEGEEMSGNGFSERPKFREPGEDDRTSVSCYKRLAAGFFELRRERGRRRSRERRRRKKKEGRRRKKRGEHVAEATSFRNIPLLFFLAAPLIALVLALPL